MSSFVRLLIYTLSVALLSSCATAGKTIDPRTISFPPPKFEIPKSERGVLPNGMVVYMLEDHELPLVNMTAYIRTGTVYDPAEKAGLASLTGTVIRSGGTKELSPEKLDEELEFMASHIESGIGPDSGTLSMATLTKNLDRSMVLFREVLTTPAFREDRVKLAVNRMIEDIRRENDDPKEVADRELRKALYAGHPLGRYPTIKSVKDVTREELIEFHRHYYHPNSIILAVSGDFHKDQLLARLDVLFGNWKKEEVAFPPVAEPVPQKPETLFVGKDVTQSVIRLGELGVDKNNPDLYALRVMDYILGGGFTSRLIQEIRSNQGLAYNVDSFIDVGRRFTGTFVAETETKSGSTVQAIKLMREIMTGMTVGPVTDRELSLARDAIINSFIFGFTKPDVVVNQQARLEFYAYPQGYLENYRDNIFRVTKEDVLRVARKYIHPESMVLMVVGDEKKFDQPLSTLGPVRQIKLENSR